MSDELSIKEESFNQIIKWLKDHNFNFGEKVIDKKLESQTQFSIEVASRDKIPFRFNIKFINEYKDSFVITAMIGITEEDHKAFNRLKEKEKKQILMDIRKILYSLNLNCAIKLPFIMIFKILTIDSINNNKQFLMDQVYNVLHGEELIQIRFDELFYTIYPEGKDTGGVNP